MDPKVQALFFFVAFICFIVAALWSAVPRPATDGTRVLAEST
jgi:hypothetical protein